MAYSLIPSQFDSKCSTCNQSIKKGDSLYYNRNGLRGKKVVCVPCYTQENKQPEEHKEEPVKINPTKIEPTIQETEPQTEAKTKHLARTIISSVLDEEAGEWRREITAKVQATIEPIARRIADEIFKDEARRTLILKTPDHKLIKITSSHFKTKDLVKRLNAGIHTYVWGPRGTGKTHTVLQVLRALGYTVNNIYMESCNPYFTPHNYLGFQNAMGGYSESALYRFLKAEGQAAFFIDEFDRQRPDAPSVLNSLLAQKHISFPNGETLYLTENKVIIASGNTNMMGGSTAYAAASRQELSTIDRFLFLHWPIDEALEKSIALSMSSEYGAIWCNWVQSVRRFISKPENRSMESVSPSPRSTFDGLRVIVNCGETSFEAAESAVFKGLDPTMQSKIIAACPIPNISIKD